MNKSRIIQPILVYMYGLPGAGKTFVSRQLAEALGIVHVSSDRLRFELFDEPHYDRSEYQIISHLMDYMTGEFLNNGLSVVYDISVNRLADRRQLRDMARKLGAKELMVWVQTDAETAWQRSKLRDHRKTDDKYSKPLNREIFDRFLNLMQNPQDEYYLVLSGKHLFNTQKNLLFRRLREIGVIADEVLSSEVPRPEMINLVSRAQTQAGRVDYSRRNIVIR
jgi:predicted kinase